MKPNSHSKNLSRTDGQDFPLIDFDYHVAALPNFRGSCARYDLSSFRNISGEYFRKEARGEFQLEFTAFAAIIVTAAIPVLSNLHALAQLARAIGSF
jgi:hypothetical protein